MNPAADAAFDFAKTIPSQSLRDRHNPEVGKAMNTKKQRGFSLIELLIVVAIIGIIAAIAIPNLLKSQQAAHETAALTEVQTIGKNQVLYSITKGHGKFADLATLGSMSYVDSNMATGNKGGYVYVTTPINADGMPAMFDTTSHPSTIGNWGVAPTIMERAKLNDAAWLELRQGMFSRPIAIATPKMISHSCLVSLPAAV
jgi:prepilin-type N-terminal cleavage/methylation domain-containing protein